ncbi:DUF427 domain-containing protein [Kineococcus sp. SYSU DK003]|uniref:DUF427 domain-containing protein n=1 Tax=Kineococcus sp. SYSU DK003 TaxID=3383124 RepID=UPI003D7D05A7
MTFAWPQTLVEPTPRRIRVRLGHRLIADSERAQLLVEYGPQSLPTYYVPLDDVTPGALLPDGPGADGREQFTVRAGDVEVPRGAWTRADVTGPFAALAGAVTFSWEALDWYEEDERVHVHARDPYKRIDTLRSSRRVQVFVGGVEVANSVHPLLLIEQPLPRRWYLPWTDVRSDLLEASDLVTQCPYKGRARYWSVRAGGEFVPDGAWSYPDPVPENPKIKDLVCFFDERVEVRVDGRVQAPPETPWS